MSACLSEWCVPVSSASGCGLTALHRAAVEGNVPCLKALVAAGVRVDAVDAQHRTAFDLAQIYTRKHCARSGQGEGLRKKTGVWAWIPEMLSSLLLLKNYIYR